MKKIRNRVFGVLFLISLVCFGAIAFYVNDYYHADETALQCISQGSEEYTISYGSQKELIFQPSSDSEVGLIFYPGGKVEYKAYAPLMSKLAEKGITCILMKMPFHLAILDTNRADGIQEQYPEIKTWYMAGHSLGGVCSAMYLEKNYENFQGLILMGAYSSVDLSKTGLKVLSIYGSNDMVLDHEKYEESKINLPDHFTEYVIEGGCHAGFGNYGAQKGDGTPEISSQKQQEITAEEIFKLVEEE